MSQEPSIREQYILDSNLMLRYALNKGIAVPSSIVKTLESYILKDSVDRGECDADSVHYDEKVVGDLKAIVTTHERLTKIVYPATPDSIRYLIDEQNKSSFLKFLSPVSFVRQMMGAALICLVVFILLSMLSYVSLTGGDEAIQGSGLPMLTNLLFFMAAAGLGASFAELFEADEYITKGTFDPIFLSSYWMRFVLGLIAGMLLATLIPMTEANDKLELLARPTLAMVGGFASSLVYRILKRFVETVEIMFGGKSKAIKVINREKSKLLGDIKKTRAKFTRQIAELSEALNSGTDPRNIKEKVEKIFDELVPPQESNEEERTYEDRKNTSFELDTEYSEDEEKFRKNEYVIPAKEIKRDADGDVG